MRKNIKIIIATHKECDLPINKIYLPIYVGSKDQVANGYTPDNTGDNIAELNPYYSELTALYWAWKNLNCDYLGLDHYRRLFAKDKVTYKKNIDINKLVIDYSDLENKLTKNKILVPRKRKYYIETLYSHYANTFDKNHLDETRKIVENKYPDYLASFDKVMNQRSGYMFNMYIMSKENSDKYCEWLFSILFELQEKISVENLSPFEARLFGRVSERLFNVWLEQYKDTYEIEQLNYINAFEINWVKKGTSFLLSKVFKKKYNKSF